MLLTKDLIEDKTYVFASHGDNKYKFNGLDGGGKAVFVQVSAEFKKGTPAMIVVGKAIKEIDAQEVKF